MTADDQRPIKAAALGGGHGLFNTITALRYLTPDVTAIVTVGDDGGSSGRLRNELGGIPPGDLRMALAALMGAPAAIEHWSAADPAKARRHKRWARILQHRLGGYGALAGHPVGNLMLAGVEELTGDPVEALDAMVDLFDIDGRVLPMSTTPLIIEADVTGLESDPRVSRVIRGQVAVATTPGTVRRVRVIPNEPDGCDEATDAIAAADVVTLGPGSWFSSVIPHVLVPSQVEALRTTTARKVLFVNLANEPGETTGFSVERHLHVLHAHADTVGVDDVIVDAASVPAGAERDHLERAAASFGARLVVADLAVPGTHEHDPRKAANTLGRLLSGEPGR
ncbi:putative gluconeogenesis factor [Gordonia spumicola]|uniref:Putative gluconeogenesis factor n=1 Tax=Gordonia spumicola TaxID=589161 RepID=A0A7I9VBK8_9ACTN|nr:uridine diphosphate-N-acetylglucosamine-binding protein YvcK [Gordonia spumicola]GEE02739.1 putative gluconeogenesis factor [Gordonia spumicola]